MLHMGDVQFSRPTIVAAAALLSDRLTQAAFNHMVLRISLENEIPSDTTLSVAKKADLLGRIALQRPDETVDTLDGSVALAEAIVREAVKLTRFEPFQPTETAFVRGLARDGYVVSFDENDRPTLRAAVPHQLGLPAADDEVHQLLNHFDFSEPLGHLEQGIDAHARGDWAAANARFRTFLELFDNIARHCEGAEKTPR
jgi:hypothetical protein